MLLFLRGRDDVAPLASSRVLQLQSVIRVKRLRIPEHDLAGNTLLLRQLVDEGILVGIPVRRRRVERRPFESGDARRADRRDFRGRPLKRFRDGVRLRKIVRVFDDELDGEEIAVPKVPASRGGWPVGAESVARD